MIIWVNLRLIFYSLKEYATENYQQLVPDSPIEPSKCVKGKGLWYTRHYLYYAELGDATWPQYEYLIEDFQWNIHLKVYCDF